MVVSTSWRWSRSASPCPPSSRPTASGCCSGARRSPGPWRRRRPRHASSSAASATRSRSSSAGRPHLAEELVASFARWVRDNVAAQCGGPPDQVAVTHPANWTAFQRQLLKGALAEADLGPVVLIAEPEAAAIDFASVAQLAPGQLVLVYDLGGGTFDVALLRREAVGFETVGDPPWRRAARRHRLRRGRLPSRAARRPGRAGRARRARDPAGRVALDQLRTRCVEAKELLSTQSSVDVPVFLPGVTTTVEVTRAAFEDMVRPMLRQTVELVRQTMERARVGPAELSDVLLVGGSSRIPMVSRLIEDDLHVPVRVDTHPKLVVGTRRGPAGRDGIRTPRRDAGAAAVGAGLRQRAAGAATSAGGGIGRAGRAGSRGSRPIRPNGSPGRVGRSSRPSRRPIRSSTRPTTTSPRAGSVRCCWSPPSSSSRPSSRCSSCSDRRPVPSAVADLATPTAGRPATLVAVAAPALCDASRRRRSSSGRGARHGDEPRRGRPAALRRRLPRRGPREHGGHRRARVGVPTRRPTARTRTPRRWSGTSGCSRSTTSTTRRRSAPGHRADRSVAAARARDERQGGALPLRAGRAEAVDGRARRVAARRRPDVRHRRRGGTGRRPARRAVGSDRRPVRRRLVDLPPPALDDPPRTPTAATTSTRRSSGS